MLKILVADDHELIRHGLIKVLRETLKTVEVEEASNGQEALNKALRSDFDLVLADISMPGRSGLEIVRELKSLKPKLPVLVLTVHPEELFAVRALRAGARGYLMKESAAEELVLAIRKVIGGGKYITASLAEKLTDDLGRDADKPPHEFLSDREHQVMLMIASGRTVSEIAEELRLSVKTISSYRSNILDKMRLKNSAEITHYAIRNRLVD